MITNRDLIDELGEMIKEEIKEIIYTESYNNSSINLYSQKRHIDVGVMALEYIATITLNDDHIKLEVLGSLNALKTKYIKLSILKHDSFDIIFNHIKEILKDKTRKTFTYVQIL